MFAHARLGVVERARAHVHVGRRADVAEHHGRGALHRRQLRRSIGEPWNAARYASASVATTSRARAVLEALLDAVPALRTGRRGRPRCRPAKLHADRGYDYQRCRAACHRRHIRPRIANRAAWAAVFAQPGATHPVTTDTVLVGASGDLAYTVGRWHVTVPSSGSNAQGRMPAGGTSQSGGRSAQDAPGGSWRCPPTRIDQRHRCEVVSDALS
jgi:hypothetical protein